MSRYHIRPQTTDGAEPIYAVVDHGLVVAVFTREALAISAADRLEREHQRRLRRLAIEKIERMSVRATGRAS